MLRDELGGNDQCGKRKVTSSRFTGGAVVASAVVALLAAGTLPASASAQGFGIYEQGTCVMGRAGAAVAQPCDDGSAMFFNPAALVDAGNVVSGGLTYILSSGEFTPDDGSPESDLDARGVPVPHLYATYMVNDDLAVGLGGYVPYGLETTWPLDFEGRFSGYDNSLVSGYIQPTIAWQLHDRVSIGGGLTIVVSEVEINQREDLAVQDASAFGLPQGTTFEDLGIPRGTDFADVELDGDGETNVGGNFGIQIELSERARFGARYMTQVVIDYDGDADFTQIETGITLPAGNPLGVPAGTSVDALLEQSGLFAPGGPLSDQGVQTSVTMPDQVVGGIAFDVTPDFTVFGDVQWTNWEDFDVVDIDFENAATPDETLIENYDNAIDLRFGTELDIHPEWRLRGGYIFTESAAPDQTVTPLLPEGDRNSGSIGVGWQTDSFFVDASYMLLIQDDRPGRVREPEGDQVPTIGLNSGVYSFEGHLIGLTAGWRF